MDFTASLPVATLSYNSLKTGNDASRNLLHQYNAPRWAAAEQFAYIDSKTFSATNGIRDWVSSSTVSLKASEGECPFFLNTSNCAAKIPCIAPINVPRSPVRSLYTSFLKVVSNK